MSELAASSAGSGDVGCIPQIYGLLDNFHRYAANGDFENYFACFHPSGRFLGTDKTENWTVSEFMSFSRPHFTLGTSAWTFTPLPESRKCDVFPGRDGRVTFATFDEHLQSESFGTTARGTGSVIWDGEGWLLAHYHLSFPIPNDLAHDMCKKIGNFEKFSSAEASRPADDDWLAEFSTHTKNIGNSKKKKSIRSGGKKK